jgi:hypothetical protein
VTILEETLTLKSSLRENQMEELFAAADVIAASVEAGKSGISQAEA